jgi:hypothetical protein
MQRFVHPARGSFAGRFRRLPLAAAALISSVAWAPQALAAVTAPFIGEIQSITVENPTDIWSKGTIVVGGEIITIPRNLLIDLPANRLTLQQLFMLGQAPANCVLAGETGLAKGDLCNTTGAGGIATIAANRTNGGNIIAGDVFIQKGIEFIGGQITFIDFTNGYFRVNGNLNDANTGTMVRINDPGARHTKQQGPGCVTGSLDNCSPDVRFTLDPDNYTNVFSTGYPWCIPSTLPRPFTGLPGVPAGTAQAAADGTGDVLCPTTNRTINNGNPVDDSRRFAPLQVGDSITAEGNFERVNGVRFLSAHSTTVSRALTTKNQADQPDYVFLSEVFIDGPAFQNQRARDLIIGFATLAPTDVKFWTLHYDPATNTAHEFPWGTVVGCDVAGGAGTCSNQGLVGAGANIFRIRHDVDFLLGGAGGQPARPKLSPCAHLRADPFFAPLNICPNARADGTSTLAEEFAILSPIPHEIQARTGHELASPGLVTVDVNGNPATHGQYLFPFGIGLGGIDIPAFDEINLDGLNTPFFFSGIPWNMDRRLSPAGCDGACEAVPQPLDPFPDEAADPRTQASLPIGPFTDPNFTASTLTSTANRILSFVDGASGNFNGNATVLAWPPAPPPASAILPTPELPLVCSLSTGVPSVGTTLNVTTAIFGTVTNTWRVSGSSTSIGSTVTVHIGDALTGTVVGTTIVPADGIWTFLQSASATPPDATQRISIEATAGGSILSVPVTVRAL